MTRGRRVSSLKQKEFAIECSMVFMNLIHGTKSGVQILTLILNSFSKICSRRYLLMSTPPLAGGSDGEYKRIDLLIRKETSVPEFSEKYLVLVKDKIL